ncbi:replication stress response regulator SDE2-like isoform X2 [Melanotaenia boesemani]|uniref:replication stress response regulator SDE2-like isoform X2 n=1 Tax=Melanotaenia boesemani TaxID=1250792 RepID=UPI001C03F440|nr:replication stress response regulator SDE2-like isoform X2 [Melanotaenia boesemani]
MEVSVVAPNFRWSTCVFPLGSLVKDVLDRFGPQQDFYVITNCHLSHLDDPLQHGSVYRLEPRLRGGKGGFGSMLRALGAQIEKTTNREACRDLSGRRLRDVNHEKEMAEWLKKQAEREAEKEQRRLERLQRKLAEPKHQFTDAQYQQQCHDLSERLEDSVLKGLQASSSSQVKVDDPAVKRPSDDQSEEPRKKKMKMTTGFWTGLEELLSSEEEEEDEESPSTSSSSCSGAAAVATTTQEEARPESSSFFSQDQRPGPSEDQRPGPSQDQRTEPRPQEDQKPALGSSCGTQKPDLSPTQQPDLSSASSAQQLDLSSFSSTQQLESLGLDVLKEELLRRGLKCGGTLSERAARLFVIRGLSPDQIDPALLARPKKK